MTIRVDFVRGARFGHPRAAGEHKVHDTETKRLRHLNFFQHRCILEVRLPRVTLPDDGVALVEPDWFGKLSGFTLLFEAFVLKLAQHMTFAAAPGDFSDLAQPIAAARHATGISLESR
jgi:transposase